MALDWARRRQLMFIGGAVLVLLAFIAILSFTIFYKTPTCFDHTQNGMEEGVDCGGSCAAACSVNERAPLVSFASVLTPGNGRTDVIAYVENRNQDAAAMNVTYQAEVRDAQGVLLGMRTGTLNLPAGRVVPVFVPGLIMGQGGVATNAFLTLATSSVLWIRSAVMPQTFTVSNTQIIGPDTYAPRVTALLTNTTTQPAANITVVATLFDASGKAIAASQTLVPSIGARGQAQLVFTWPAALSGDPIRADIVPLVPSP